MANEKLIEIRPGGGLDSGVFPTAEPTAGPIWRLAQNAWFRPLKISHTLGRTKVVNVLGRASQAMTQAYADGETRLYYEDLGLIHKWDGVAAPVLIGEFATEGDYDLEPYGTWLLGTDNVGVPGIWKNDELGFIPFGTGEFARAKIIKKLAQRAIVYSTDTLPVGMHYSKPSDPEIWAVLDGGGSPTGAGNLPFRNLDSEIICVADLGGAHGVYTEDKLLVLEYLGETLKFGTPRQPLAGIGAVSKESVVVLGSRNFGLFPGGIFVTDGLTYRMLDDPAMSDWLRTEVDWNRGNEVSGYYDKRLLSIVWAVPTTDASTIAITMDLQGRFSFMSAMFRSSLEQEIFDAGFVGEQEGIFKISMINTVLGTFTLGTHLLDGGTKDRYKAWDLILLEGKLSGQIRVGYADDPSFDNIEWSTWQDVVYRIPLTPRESVYLAFEITSETVIDLSAIKIYGALAGLVT